MDPAKVAQMVEVLSALTARVDYQPEPGTSRITPARGAAPWLLSGRAYRSPR
jgi:hypothetical protein